MRVLFACFALLSAVSASNSEWLRIARIAAPEESSKLDEDYCVGVDSSCGISKRCPLKAVLCERGLWFRKLYQEGGFKLEAMSETHPGKGSGFCIDNDGTSDNWDYEKRTAIQFWPCDTTDDVWEYNGEQLLIWSYDGDRVLECLYRWYHGQNLCPYAMDVQGHYTDLENEPVLQLWTPGTHDHWKFVPGPTTFTKIIHIEFLEDLFPKHDWTQALLGKTTIDACFSRAAKATLDFGYSQGNEVSASSSVETGFEYSTGEETTDTVSVSAGDVFGIGVEASIARSHDHSESFSFSTESTEARTTDGSVGAGLEISLEEGEVGFGALFGQIYEVQNEARLANVTGETINGDEETVEMFINVAGATNFGAATTNLLVSIKPKDEDACREAVLCLNQIHHKTTYEQAWEMVNECKGWEDPDEPAKQGKKLKTGHVCLDVDGTDDPDSHDRYVGMWNCDETNDKWVFDDGKLQRQGSEMCLNNKSGYGDYSKGQEVEVYPCHATDAKWVLRDDHRLQLQETRFCLDVKGRHAEVNGEVQLWPCSKDPTDIWEFV